MPKLKGKTKIKEHNLVRFPFNLHILTCPSHVPSFYKPEQFSEAYRTSQSTKVTFLNFMRDTRCCWGRKQRVRVGGDLKRGSICVSVSLKEDQEVERCLLCDYDLSLLLV